MKDLTEIQFSELFDEEILPLVIAQYGVNDKPAINEAFNNWKDSLAKDGLITEEQDYYYCYEGRLS